MFCIRVLYMMDSHCAIDRYRAHAGVKVAVMVVLVGVDASGVSVNVGSDEYYDANNGISGGGSGQCWCSGNNSSGSNVSQL